MTDRRQPTSHERRATQSWDASYRAGDPPPWDIGEPQPAIARLAADGGFAGDVLDAGCGTGENALHVAALGLRVVGVDAAETAVSIARQKSVERGVDAEFRVADALRLEDLDQRFDTVLDSGLFHNFDSEERRRYVAGLASVTARGASLHVLCFSDADAGCCVPHPVTEQQLRAPFEQDGRWSVVSIRPVRIQTLFAVPDLPGWLASIERS